jgi:tripartite ATP-independent transporter DctM subunit
VLTPTIPPGIGMIIYGTIGQVSIGRLFAAGFVPAILLWIALGTSVWLTARRRGYMPERRTRPTVGEVAAAFRGGVWALLFPVFLLVGLRMGVFTPSEIGAFAVIYAVFIGVLIYRQLGRKSFTEALEGSLADVGSVMFLIALSAIFSYGIVIERVPEVVSGWILGITENLYAVMVLIALFVLACGFFIDATVLIIMLTPIFLPLVRQLGADPVHFGLVFIVAATIGNFTPPVGAAMYAVCSIVKCPIGEYTRGSIPLFAAVALVTLVLAFIPSAVLFVPNLIFGAP